MAKNNQRDPNLRAATVARVNELVKSGFTKAGAFEKISVETGRAKDAVQMLYYRAIRAAKSPKAGKASVKAAAPKAAAPVVKSVASKAAAPKPAAPKAAAPVAAAPAAKPAVRRGRRPGRPAQSALASNDFPALLNGIANAINELLKHVEKTVEENKTLREQSQRLATIANLVRGR